MKINSKEILSALKKVSPAIGVNRIVPICEYAKIESFGKEAVVTATNLNLTCLAKFELLEESHETILVPFQELEKICSLTDEIEIDKNLKISFGGEYQILGIPEDYNQYPIIPTFDEAFSFEVDGDFFFSLSQALKSTHHDPVNPLNNIFLENDNDGLSIFSYGNSALYVDRTEKKSDSVFGASIPPDFVKATRGMQGATVYVTDSKIKAQGNGYSVICNLAACTRLGYKKAYEIDKTPNCTVDRDDLILAIQKRESLKVTTNYHQINILLGKDKMTLANSDSELNREGKSYCACNNSSNVDKIIFNSSVLKSAISQTTSSTLNFRFTSYKDPAILTDDNVSVFISPMFEVTTVTKN